MLRALFSIVLLTTTSLAAPDAKQLAKDRAASAEKIYQATVTAMKAGRAVVETAYTWSVRTLDAELDAGRPAKAALVDHQMRMTKLAADVISMKASGVIGALDADAAEYFKLEADFWVARGKR